MKPTTDTMSGEQLGEALRLLRWRQVDFARRCGVTPTSVNAWVNGRAPVPQWALAVVSMALDIRALSDKHLAPVPAEPAPAASPAPSRLAHVLEKPASPAPD